MHVGAHASGGQRLMLGVFFSCSPSCFFETRSFTNSGAHWFNETGWPVSSRDLPFRIPMPRFYVGGRDLNLGSHTCVVNTFLTEPSLKCLCCYRISDVGYFI